MIEEDVEKLYQEFKITGVCRADLISQGFTEAEVMKVADINMAHLANKMADAYCENSYWIDLDILAEDVLGLHKSK